MTISTKSLSSAGIKGATQEG